LSSSRAFLLSFLLLAALPVCAQTVVSVTGTPVNDSHNPGGAGFATWTQTGTFSNVTIQATIYSCYETASGYGYLTLNGTAQANQVAQSSLLSVGSSSYNGATTAQVTVFTGLTLGPGTYYLTISPTGSECGKLWEDTASPTESTATGVSLPATAFGASSWVSGSFNQYASINSTYPPAGTFYYSNGPYFLYTVTGSPVGGTTPAVPAMTLPAAIGLCLLLLGSGLLLLRPQRRRV
jgi:hypothetical protein